MFCVFTEIEKCTPALSRSRARRKKRARNKRAQIKGKVPKAKEKRAKLRFCFPLSHSHWTRNSVPEPKASHSAQGKARVFSRVCVKYEYHFFYQYRCISIFSPHCRQSCSVLCRLSCSDRPVLAVLSWLLCSGCPVLLALSACLVFLALLCLPHSCCPVLAVLF